jgi:folylpolyglutamate synthase
VLIFNQQGRSEAVDLLDGLYAALQSEGSANFDHVVFCTNVTFAEKGYKRGWSITYHIPLITLILLIDFVNNTYDAAAIAGLIMQKQFAEKWRSLDPKASVTVLHSIEEALGYARGLAKDGENENEVQLKVHALVTGSLHLVGGAIGVLEGASAL